MARQCRTSAIQTGAGADSLSYTTVQCFLKHLALISAVVTRLANNSFLIKGWSLTLVSALATFILKESVSISVALIPLVGSSFLWFLDAYYLQQERLFRKLYNEVRVLNEKDIDFSMVSNATVSFFAALWSRTLVLFHALPVLMSLIVIILSLKC